LFVNAIATVSTQGSAFKTLKDAESLASAKIGLLVPLTNGCFGLALVDDRLMIIEGEFYIIHSDSPLILCSVITMYKKREQGTHGHHQQHPLVPCLTLQFDATSTSIHGNVNSKQWNVL